MTSEDIQTYLEIGVAALSILGFLYGGWKMVITPIKKATAKLDKLDLLVATINDDILPVIQSLHREFSKNSGKSIKDQITRIDNNTKVSDSRIRLIATNLVSTGLFECDASGMYTWVNKALSDMFGLEREEMLENGWISAIVAEDRNRVWKNWTECVAQHIPYEEEYTVFNRKTNEEFSVRVVAIANKNDYGQILSYLGTIAKN